MRRLLPGLTLLTLVAACHWPTPNHDFVDVTADVPTTTCGIHGGCNPVEGSGCAGNFCRVTFGPAFNPYCGSPGTGAEGARCASDGDCDRGTHCVPNAGFNPGTGMCLRLCCRGMTDQCGASSTCAVRTPDDHINACTARSECVYAPSDTCTTGRCYPSGVAGFNHCGSIGTGTVDHPCEFFWDCGPGLTCAATASSDAGMDASMPTGLCRPLCHDSGDCASSGGTCQVIPGQPSDYQACIR